MGRLGDGSLRTEQVDCSVHGHWRSLELESPAHILTVVLGKDDDPQVFNAFCALEGGLERRYKRSDYLGEFLRPNPFHGQLLTFEFDYPFHDGTMPRCLLGRQHG